MKIQIYGVGSFDSGERPVAVLLTEDEKQQAAAMFSQPDAYTLAAFPDSFTVKQITAWLNGMNPSEQGSTLTNGATTVGSVEALDGSSVGPATELEAALEATTEADFDEEDAALDAHPEDSTPGT